MTTTIVRSLTFMTTIWIYSILLSISILGISCHHKSADEYIKEAARYEAMGHYTTANALLDKAIRKDRNSLGAYMNRGANKAALGLHQEAIADYDTILSKDATNIMAIYNIANNYFKLEHFKTAITYYSRGLRLSQSIYMQSTRFDKNNSKADFYIPAGDLHYGRGLAYMYADSLKQSFQDFEYSLASKHFVPESYYWMGIIYLKHGNRNKGCDYLYKSKSFGYAKATESINQYCNAK